MATPTNNGPTGKISRIHKEERQLLSQLREVYNNDYKKYFEYIRRGVNIPLAVRKIYRGLDEHKAYRRISDYFHRQRIAKRPKRFKVNDRLKSTRISIQLPRTTMNSNEKFFENDDRFLQTSTKKNETDLDTNDRMDDDDDIQEIQPLSSITFTQQRLQNTSDQLPAPQSTDLFNSQPNLLSIRQNLQKALRELDHAIIIKTDNVSEENTLESSKSLLPKANEQCYGKLDDLVRSLSTVVDQQQENVRLIINESSVLLLDDSKPSEKLSSTTQDSIKHILERLNVLVDRGHRVYDRIEDILSKF